jgi:plasmid stabilization system protein ParE
MKPRRVVFSPAACDDMADIHAYIWMQEPMRATPYVAEMEASIYRTAGLGYTPQSRPDLGPNIHGVP